MKALSKAKEFAEFIAKLVMAILAAILGPIGRILGVAPSPTRQVPQLSATSSQLKNEYRDAIKNTKSLKPAAPSKNGMSSEIGSVVYTYAAAPEPTSRSAIDLSMLTPDQQDWLAMLSDGQLRQLALAGPKACALAAAGRKCGIVGFPVYKEPAQEVPVLAKVMDIREAIQKKLDEQRSVRTGGYAFGR